MNIRSRIVLTGLAVGGLLCAFVQPAIASAGKLTCDLGSGFVSCELDSVGVRASFHDQAWMFGGVQQPAENGRSAVSFSCTPGSAVSVRVSYLDQAGAGYVGSFTGTCS